MKRLEVRALSHSYGRRTVLDRIDFAAEAGEVTAIIGPNGAGKSTLLRVLTGLVASHDKVFIDDQALDGLGSRERARRLAYVPQHSQLDAALSVREVVAQARYCWREGPFAGGAEDHQHVDRALEGVGIRELGPRSYLHLSGGERRLVTIARALCSGAPVLALDEPTSSLDIAYRLRICQLMRDLAAAGRCVICVLHELDDALRFADRALLLEKGREVAQGAVAEVITREHVATVYGVELQEGTGYSFRRLEAKP